MELAILLSYRHAFHAGNFADLIKHIVLVEVLQYLTRKDKPFDYIDTHAGAGVYDLESGLSQKLGEYKDGIAKLDREHWPELEQYFKAIDAVNPKGGQRYYPGSPVIAQQLLRPQDRAWLHELHSTDSEALSQHVKGRNVRVFEAEGYQGLLALVPPASRRALVLIDPSYEIKTEYQTVVETVIKAHSKFATGIYAIWYPVVERSRIERMEKKLLSSGIKRIDRYELAASPDSHEHGMTASGMIVINPPWGLRDTMEKLLPRLVQALGDDGAFYRCEEWAGE